MQTGIVLGSKVCQFISVYIVHWILVFSEFCKIKKLNPSNRISSDLRSELRSSPKMDLSHFVLHLKGEGELVDLMMTNNFDVTDHWLQRGKKKQPKYLIEMLEKSTVAEGLKGVKEFDYNLVLSLECDEPPNCWTLPVVTLTTIAAALPNFSSLIKQLICSVHGGLMNVKLNRRLPGCEKNFDYIRKAENVVWLGVDLYQKWLDVDPRKLSLQAQRMCSRDLLMLQRTGLGILRRQK